MKNKLMQEYAKVKLSNKLGNIKKLKAIADKYKVLFDSELTDNLEYENIFRDLKKSMSQGKMRT